MGSYQDRKDIDRLYHLVWNSESDTLNFVTKEELEEVKQDIATLFELYESLVGE